MLATIVLILVAAAAVYGAFPPVQTAVNGWIASVRGVSPATPAAPPASAPAAGVPAPAAPATAPAPGASAPAAGAASAAAGPAAHGAPAAGSGTPGTTGGTGGSGAATTPPPAKKKQNAFEKFWRFLTGWIKEPKILPTRIARAGLVLLGVWFFLEHLLPFIGSVLLAVMKPVFTPLVRFWGEPWMLVVFFVVVGLFGTRIAAWAWKGLFKTHATPFDGADGFMGKVRKEYQNAFIVGIFIAVGVFYLLDPQVQTSILGNWVPERFWALGNLAVLTQTTILFLVLFIWSRKIKGTFLKYMLVLVTGLGFFVSLERLAHLGVNRCPRPLHMVYVWVDTVTDINNLEGETTIDEWQERLQKSRKSATANTVGYLPEDTAPYTLWYTQFPNNGMIWPGDSLKGEFLIPAGAPLSSNGLDEVLANVTVEVLASKDFKTVVVLDTLRTGNVGESQFNWRFEAAGIWNAIDAAGHSDWRARGAVLGFRLVDRNPFVNVIIRDIVAYH